MKELTKIPIQFAIDINLPIEKHSPATRGSYDITCPFCGGVRKFNVSLTKNVARCNKCDEAVNATTLHAKLNGLTTQEAYHKLAKMYEGEDISYKDKMKKDMEKKGPDIVPASLEVRDMVYRIFLANLTLSKAHHQDLSKRGLTDEQIEAGLYKTVPSCGLHTFAYKAIYESNAINHIAKNEGIPGFYDLHDEKKISACKRKNGYFVPVITMDGLISGLQIRYDNLSEDATEKEKESYHKYAWYSSSEKARGCGITGCENIHFTGNWKDKPTRICITEGPLKADIASALSGEAFIGLTGVNNIGQLLKCLVLLKNQGLKKVYICVDMDYRTKETVARALERIKQIVNRAGSSIVCPKSIKKTDDEFYICFDKPLPKDLVVSINKHIIDSSKYKVVGSKVFFLDEVFFTLPNDREENTVSLYTGKKQLIFSTKFYKRNGLLWQEKSWDENYKGIDDYLIAKKML